MRIYWFIVGSLTVWRISYLLTSESGPRDVLVIMRRRFATGIWADVATCLYCMSIWIAAPLAWILGESVVERLLLWPALSAAAIVTERAIHRDTPVAAALYYEDKEARDVLRKEPEPNSGQYREPQVDGPDASNDERSGGAGL
ncbi:hypothetical protein OKW38_001587 [Paraburkholderia sp. MM5496-R1]|uniref:hypothetical protein n=1 Tax=Paraburkholderia sp. MM5496-R1 TaxID=2991065 RepID=UPI003D1DC47E